MDHVRRNGRDIGRPAQVVRGEEPLGVAGEPDGRQGAGRPAEVGPGTASFAARELGRGWKVQPYVNAAPGETLVLCDLDGPGCLQHVWMTLTGNLRHQVLRIYWDGQERPSVECPPGDDGVYRSQTRFGLYRWHIADPIRFASDLRVSIQALGWRPDGRYLPLQDDIASTAFWYQTLPTAPFPALPDRDACEVV